MVLPIDSPSVLVIGGGLAGLAATVALAERGFRVTLLESRNRLGGRAGSFVDANTGQMIDACQHVSMGCCTNLTHFFQTIGVAQYLEPQRALYFVTPDGRVSRFAADPWPAPLHLGRALAAAHYLTTTEKLRIAYGLAALLREAPDADPPLEEWLFRYRQTRRTIDRFWGVVLVSALNESVNRAGLRYARKVFCDGFLRHRDGFTVHLPTVPLGKLYGEALGDWLTRHGVTTQLNAGVRGLEAAPSPGSGQHTVAQVRLRDGRTLTADHYVLAVPYDRVSDLLPEPWRDAPPFAGCRALEPSPITSVHLWYDRPITRLPHAVLVDCVGQWLFNRGRSSEWSGEYVQVVVSASRSFHGQSGNAIAEQITAELARIFPASREAQVLRHRVITEHTATFRVTPGIDRWRPTQASPLSNLALAGDWTATGWPATMEGAVRSGYRAAEVILTRCGRPATVQRPDLGHFG
ncbi:MAG: hydroxysqualene dehydroxylase HpnE [Bacteroidales bacterium]|nr:hydroxysqualene dehydroxylase HpnE [Bacteroidales bacterium]